MTVRRLAAVVSVATLAVGLAAIPAEADSPPGGGVSAEDWCVSGFVQDNPEGRALAELRGLAVGDASIICADDTDWPRENVVESLVGITYRECREVLGSHYYQRQERLVALDGPAVLNGLAMEYPFNGPWLDVGRKRYAGANRGENCLGDNVPRTLPKNPRQSSHPLVVYEYRIVLVEEGVRFVKGYTPERAS